MQKVFSLTPLAAPLRGFRLVGELDMGSARDLTDALTALSGDGDVRLELSELEFIDSSGLHAIAQYAGSLDGGGEHLILANPSAMTARVFEIAEFAKHPRIVIEVTSGE
jgi:anti-anti-sigma factor